MRGITWSKWSRKKQHLKSNLKVAANDGREDPLERQLFSSLQHRTQR